MTTTTTSFLHESAAAAVFAVLQKHPLIGDRLTCECIRELAFDIAIAATPVIAAAGRERLAEIAGPGGAT